MAAFGFTRASEQDVFSLGPELNRSVPSIKLSGEEARTFYEEMMKADKQQSPSGSRDEKDCGRASPTRQKNGGSSRKTRRRVRAADVRQVQAEPAVQREVSEVSGQVNQGSNSERFMELMGLRLLRCAHEGDVSGLKELLSKGVDINFQDTFLWTAVMCASWSGQKAAVRLLLSHGAAWVGVVDAHGRDAQDLALEAGQDEVLEEFLSYCRSPERETQSSSSALQPQWCDVCSSEYRSSPSSHFSSTLHQFSLRRPPPTPYYCLPPSSNSYKMMVRCGWKPGMGLGPEGEGPQQPVPTVLKRDQKGLGYGQTKRAKVTHFQARDRSAVKAPHREEGRRLKGQRKEETKRKEQRDKNWERDFRASFYL